LLYISARVNNRAGGVEVAVHVGVVSRWISSYFLLRYFLHFVIFFIQLREYAFEAIKPIQSHIHQVLFSAKLLLEELLQIFFFDPLLTAACLTSAHLGEPLIEDILFSWD